MGKRNVSGELVVSSHAVEDLEWRADVTSNASALPRVKNLAVGRWEKGRLRRALQCPRLRLAVFPDWPPVRAPLRRRAGRSSRLSRRCRARLQFRPLRS